MDSGGGTSLDPEASAQRPPKRVVFDRRYGWMYLFGSISLLGFRFDFNLSFFSSFRVDDWRSPSEEALAGSRGM